MDSVRTYVGIIDPTTTSGATGASYAFVDKAILSRNGNYYNTGSGTGGTASATFTAYAVNDVVMIAYKNGKIWFGKNGTWMNSGDPAADTNAVDSAVSTARAWRPYFGYNSSWTANFGQRPFAYTPPTGFKALHTGNLPDSAIVDGGEYFNVDTYAGTGATNARTIGFQPDFVWIKSRTNAYWHKLFDSVRGANKPLVSNDTTAELTETTGLMSFDSDGFTLGTSADSTVNNSGSGQTFVAWNWKAGTAFSNDAGTNGATIASVGSVNQDAGFSIVTYTADGVATATIGHGLGATPDMIITFGRTGGSTNHAVYHSSLPNASSSMVWLDLAAAAVTNAGYWNATAPTSTVFSGGASGNYVNNTGWTMVAYCFAEVEGYSKIGKWQNNNSTDGTFVYLGFRPRFILLKNYDNAESWYIWDSVRQTYNVPPPSNNWLSPRLPNSEAANSATTVAIDGLSNGFKIRTTNPASGEISFGTRNYIYMAFAENPFKNSLAR